MVIEITHMLSTHDLPKPSPNQARWADAGGAGSGGPLQGAPAAGQSQAASASGRGPRVGITGITDPMAEIHRNPMGK